MKIVAVVAVRMSSNRLPGKVILPFVGQPSLKHVVKRIKQSKYIHEVVIATTLNEIDNIIIEIADDLGIPFYRGSEEDVLTRTLEAAKSVHGDVIVHITSDCPLTDAETIDTVVQRFLDHPYLHYVSNQQIITYPLGFKVEVFRTNDLEKISHLPLKETHREHVTNYFHEHPKQFHLSNVEAPFFLRHPEYQLALNTLEDYEVIRTIFESLFPKNEYFTLYDIVRYLEKYPEVVSYNQHLSR